MDETELLQLTNIFRDGIDGDTEPFRDGGIADDALVGVAVLNAHQVRVDYSIGSIFSSRTLPFFMRHE